MYFTLICYEPQNTLLLFFRQLSFKDISKSKIRFLLYLLLFLPTPVLFIQLCRSRLSSGVIFLCLKEFLLLHFLQRMSLLVMNSFSFCMSEKCIFDFHFWKMFSPDREFQVDRSFLSTFERFCFTVFWFVFFPMKSLLSF